MRSRTTFIGVLVLAQCTFAAFARAQPGPVFTAEDMLAIRTLTGGQPLAVSPSGRWIAYVLTDRDDEWNVQEPRPTGYVHVQALAGGRPGAPRALTSGAAHSAFPVWSPDGRRLAFIREEQGRGRAVVWDPERDQMTPVGDPFAARIYLAPQWDPAGKTLIVAAALPDQAPQPYRVRSVKTADPRIPGDQFFTDDRKATLTAIDVAGGASTALTRAPIVLRSFRLSPTGGQLSYVTPVPETLGVIGKEQNDTFVLAIDAARGAAPATAVKLAERGRFSWSPDGVQLLFVKDGRLMALPADGRGAARPWRDGFTLAVNEPVWAPDGSRFAALVADPSVTDPELEPAKPGMYTAAQPFMDLYVVKADGSSANVTSGFDDQISDPVWSPDGGALFFRAVNNKTYDETVYRYSVAEQKVDAVVRGQASYGRLAA